MHAYIRNIVFGSRPSSARLVLRRSCRAPVLPLLAGTVMRRGQLVHQQTGLQERISRRRMFQAVFAGAAAALVTGKDGKTWASGSPEIVFPWLVPHSDAGLASLHAHAGVITHLSPAWYVMNDDLSVTSSVDAGVKRFVRDHGIKLVPLIKNDQFSAQVAHDILATSASRASAARIIASLVLDNNYDGINMDFEGAFGTSRDAYSDLISRISARLRPKGRLLTVDVVPQLQPASSYPPSSGAAPYDYSALGRVCDAVMVMCYSYSHRKPGSLSPLWWLRDALVFARRHIPRKSLVVGMGFYGRHWIVKDQQIRVVDLTQPQAEALLAQSGASVERPAAEATPRFGWTDAAGAHIVHFEDAQSLGAKLKVIRAAKIAGGAFWRLGQEDPAQWRVIARWL